MKHALGFWLAAGALLIAPLFGSSAQAQHFGAGIARPMSVQPRATYSRRIAPRQTFGSGARGARYAAPFSAGGYGSTLQQLLDPVPPPGFDYQYLSAIDSDLAVKAFIDPVTQLRLAAARRFLRGNGFSGAGYYLLGGDYYYLPGESDEGEQPPPQQPAPQPQIIVLQQPAPAEQAPQPATEAEPEAPPLPDVGQFVLVLRNGTRIQAVAFTRSDDRIVYITADGSRRTIAASDLDSAATIQVNQERGTPLQLSL